MVRCATLPHVAAWNEHHAVPTVANESNSNAKGSKDACFGAGFAGTNRSAVCVLVSIYSWVEVMI